MALLGDCERVLLVVGFSKISTTRGERVNECVEVDDLSLIYRYFFT